MTDTSQRTGSDADGTGDGGRIVPLLRVRSLRVRYGEDRPAVDDASFDLGAGSILALVGESGSGKSTIAKAMLGLLPPSAEVSGSIHYRGEPILPLTERRRRALMGREIAYIPQDPFSSLNPVQRVGTQLAEALSRDPAAGRSRLRQRVEELLERVGVPQPALRARQYPHELSGGLRQRIVIGVALALRPSLVVADEPTSALDASVQRRVLDLLVKLAAQDGASVLLVTHDLGVAGDRADRVVVLRHGSVVEEGATAQILRSSAAEYTRRLVAASPAFRLRERPGAPVAEERSPVRPLIEVDGVSKRFGRGRDAVQVLRDVSLQLRSGGALGIVGESGSGKTTLARIIGQFESASSGRVTIDGEDTAGWSAARRREFRRFAQFVYQDPYQSLDPRWSIHRIVSEPLRVFGLPTRTRFRDEVAGLLRDVGLPEELASRLPAALSGGQRQRVALARALALSPELLVLDEPVSALDVISQANVLDLIADLKARRGLSLLFISHDLAVVQEVCTELVVLKDGAIVERGNAAEVFGLPQDPYTRQLIEAMPGRGTPLTQR